MSRENKPEQPAMNDADAIAIKVDGVSKTFKLPHEKQNSVKSLFVGMFKGKRSYEKQQVLKNINFEIKKGEFFGIVGRNGSGKSTLLKLLAGIYTPDKGHIQINGKLVPFIELGVGFNPELTGRENVFLNGALLGFSRKEMLAMYDDIVEFAELEKFMDQKLKNYSSGMQVRLAFSIAIRAKADILVLDEVLAVGDEAFQRKCYQYFAQLKREKKTVILVTHSMDSVLNFCNRVMLIDKGHKSVIGSPLEIASLYRQLNDQEIQEVNVHGKTKSKNIKVLSGVHTENNLIKLKFDILPKQNLPDPVITIEIFRDSGEQVYRWVSDEKTEKPLILKKDRKINFILEIKDVFPVGIFSIRLSIKKRDRSEGYGTFDNIESFVIKNKSPFPYDTFWKPEEKSSIQVVDEQ